MSFRLGRSYSPAVHYRRGRPMHDHAANTRRQTGDAPVPLSSPPILIRPCLAEELICPPRGR